MATETEVLKVLLRKVVDGGTLTDDDRALLERAVTAYPYAAIFQVIKLAFSGNLTQQDVAALRRRVALMVSDPRTIDVLRGVEWNSFYPQAVSDDENATDNAIDIFLSTYGHRSKEEDALLERMIFNPTPDYAEVLAREEQEDLPDEPVDPDSPEGRIDAFILSRHPAAAHDDHDAVAVCTPDAPPIHKPTKETDDDTLLSESLARVYITQHKYERAYAIIEGLSSKYPRKNSYFAAQLSYLRKLIRLQQQTR